LEKKTGLLWQSCTDSTDTDHQKRKGAENCLIVIRGSISRSKMVLKPLARSHEGGGGGGGGGGGARGRVQVPRGVTRRRHPLLQGKDTLLKNINKRLDMPERKNPPQQREEQLGIPMQAPLKAKEKLRGWHFKRWRKKGGTLKRRPRKHGPAPSLFDDSRGKSMMAKKKRLEHEEGFRTAAGKDKKPEGKGNGGIAKHRPAGG